MKQRIHLTEAQLNKIIKESVSDVLNEELNKSINYHYSEALEHLMNLQNAYENLPDEYSYMKQDCISRIRSIIRDLQKVYSGKDWQEEGPSLSMMNRM